MNSFHEIKYNNYLSSLFKNDNKFIYIKYIINKVDINIFGKLFNDYITNHNKKVDFYYINCEFQIAIDNRLLNIEINFHHNTDYINLKCYLLFYTESQGINFFNIDQRIINII